MNFVSADWHLFEENIMKHCKRPFGNTNHYKKTLIRNVNEACSPEDDLWLVGDYSMKGVSYRNAHADFIGRINCNIHIVVGNHDPMTPLDYIRIGFKSVHTWFPLEDYMLIHNPYDEFTTTFPEDTKWLCGHVHHYWLFRDNRVNVGVDQWDFKPVSLHYLRTKMATIKYEMLREKQMIECETRMKQNIEAMHEQK